MRLAVTHETVYRFERPALRAIQTLRLTPRNTEAQLVQNWRIDVSQDCRLSPVEDAFGNLTHSFSIDGPIDEMSIVATGTVVTEDTAGVLRSTREKLPLAVFCRVTDRTRAELAVQEFARSTAAAVDGGRLARMHALMGRVHERVKIVADAPDRLPDATLAKGEASVAGATELFLAAARVLDMPVRCISGWVLPDGSKHFEATSPRLWIEAHLGDGLGWVAFDCIENMCPTDRWVRVAAGLDALDVSPIRGVRATPAGETVTTRIILRDVGPA